MSPRQRRSISAANLALRVGIGLGALLLSVGIFAALVATRPTPPLTPRSEILRTVRVIELHPVEVARQWLGFGTTRALQTAEVAAEVAGTIIERPSSIEPGLPVRAGQLIVALDATEFIAQADRARHAMAAIEAERAALAVDEEVWASSLELARENIALLRSELEQLRSALAASGATQVEVDRLRRQITSAEREAEAIRQLFEQIPARRAALEARLGVERANLALAELDVRRSRILAPFDGTLQAVNVREGERVTPGTPVARIVNLSRIEAPLRVPVSALNELTVGSRATLTTSGPARRTWEATVSRIAPEADEQTRTATVYVEVRQDPGLPTEQRLAPGRFVTATLYAQRPIQALVAPRSAVNGDRVMVMHDSGHAAVRTIEVAFHIEQDFPSILPGERQWAVIARGLAPGDRLIISNLDELRPGMTIRTPTSGPPEPVTAQAAAARSTSPQEAGAAR